MKKYLWAALAAAVVAFCTGCGDRGGVPNVAMVFVEGGTSTMKYRNDTTVTSTITVEDFYIGKTEVTQRLWKSVMGGNPSYFKGNRLPVDSVSWDDAQEFIKKLNAKTGKNYRLPTGAEWKYAAHKGNKNKESKYSGGNNIKKAAERAKDRATVCYNTARSNGWPAAKYNDYKPRPVGSKRANELGIHDMYGNVREWVGNNYGPLQMYCGGYFGVVVYYPYLRRNNLGFRLAISAATDTSITAAADTSAAAAPETAAASPLDASSNPDSVAMAFVEGGTFFMGCINEFGDECRDDEKPGRSVTVGDFRIAKYEVTQGLWKSVMGSSHSYFKGDNLPAEMVSWDDAQEFIRKLNAKTGKNYRLPTEAEWKYAALGGNKSRGYKHSGGNNIDDVAWCSGNSGGKTRPVGTKAANELGIHDMSGNVQEWTNDEYERYEKAIGYVIRGGSWYDWCDDDAGWANSHSLSNRSWGSPDSRHFFHGFRLALDP